MHTNLSTGIARSTRDRILDAAAHVIRTQGLARATTKEIARAAGYSEAALYKHFRDKTDLFLTVLSERVPSYLDPLLRSLLGQAGQGNIRDALRQVARTAVDFFGETFPMAGSVFSEPDLLATHAEAMRGQGRGPQHINDSLADFFRAEQECGRIRADVDPQSAAALLLGACFQRAFLRYFADPHEDDGSGEQFVLGIVDALLVGLTPAD